MAALHRALGDDLRRPRHPRRLEHVDLVAGGDARKALVGSQDHGRNRELLGLPGAGELLPGPDRGPGAARPPQVPARLRPGAARVGAGRRLGQRGQALEPLAGPRRRPGGDARLTRGPRAGREPAPDVRRRGMEMARGGGDWRRQAPGHRRHPADLSAAGDSQPRILERRGRRRSLDKAHEGLRRAGAPGTRSRALGCLSPLVRPDRRADPSCREPASGVRPPPRSCRSEETSITPTSPTWSSRRATA